MSVHPVQMTPEEIMQALSEWMVSTGNLFEGQMGQFVEADQQYSGLVPSGYSLEFMYPQDLESGDYEWEWDPDRVLPISEEATTGRPSEEGVGGFGATMEAMRAISREPSPGEEGAIETDVPVMRAYTMRDEIDRYLNTIPGSAAQEALAETLWSNNFYTDGTSRDEILQPRHIDSAFQLGVTWGARQGVSIWDMEAGPGREDTAATALTDASIYYSAETAAKQSFGRSATSAEKQMAVKISRALEAAGVPVSRADIAAELETGAPDEVKARDMSTTLRYLMKAMAGRGAS
jgi:hypothetical protein